MKNLTYLARIGRFMDDLKESDRRHILDKFAEQLEAAFPGPDPAVPVLLHFGFGLYDPEAANPAERYRLYAWTALADPAALLEDLRSFVTYSLAPDEEANGRIRYVCEVFPRPGGRAVADGEPLDQVFSINYDRGERTYGTVVCYFDRPVVEVMKDSERVAFVTTLARMTNLYLGLYLSERKNRERYETQLRDARAVQRMLLPDPDRTPPDFPGEAAHLYRPLRDEVAGDYFDYFAFRDGSAGVIVADVSGKGAPAALVMAKLQTLVTSAAARFVDPGRFLSFLNDQLAGQLDDYRFVTIVCLRIGADGRGAIANGGHNPTLLYRRAARRIEALPAPNPPVGILKGARFSTRPLRVEPGDRVLLYTDGITEARNPAGAFFGEERLAALLAETAAEPPAGILARVTRELDGHRDGRALGDDATLVILAPRPSAPEVKP